jgi:hypothetical protein
LRLLPSLIININIKISCSSYISKQSICLLAPGLIGFDFMLKIALMKCTVHDEILGSVVGQHDNEAAEVGLDSVEF